jgi:hypothetical protein
MTKITLYTNDKTETCITCLKRRPARNIVAPCGFLGVSHTR